MVIRLIFLFLMLSLGGDWALAQYLSPDKPNPLLHMDILNSFAKGQNDRDKADIIDDTQAVLLQNAIVEDTGIVRKRKGLQIIGDDLGSTAGLGINSYKHSTAGLRHLVAFNGTIYKLNATETTWTSISTGLTANLDVTFIFAGDYAFIMNGTDRIRYYNAAAETVTTFGSTATDPPLAKIGVYARERVFVVDEGNPSRIRYSDSGNVLNYPALNDIPVNEKDGQRINSLFIFKDDMLIFKERSVWALNISASNYLTSLTLELIDNNYGTLSPESVRQIGNDVIFIDQYGDVRSLIRTALGDLTAGARPFSDTIRGTIDKNFPPTADGINRAYIDKISSIVYRDNYYMAYPNGTNSTNNRVAVWNMRQGSWVIFIGWNISHWAQFTLSNIDYLVGCEATNDSLVYKCFQGTSDNGAAIDFDVKTKELKAGWVGDKEWILLDILGDADGGNLVVSTQLDAGGWQTLGTFAMIGDAPALPQTLPFNLGSETNARTKYHLNTLGRADGLQVRLRNNTSTDTITVRNLIVFSRLLPYYKE